MNSNQNHRVSKLKECCTGIRNFKQDVKVTGIGKYHFTKSEWGNFSNAHKVSLPYMIWRGLFLSFFIFALINSIQAARQTDGGMEFYFIYLTNWSLCIQLMYSLLFFIHHVFFYFTDILFPMKEDGQIGKANPRENIPVVIITDRDLIVHEKGTINNSATCFDEKNSEFKNIGCGTCSEDTSKNNWLESVIWILFNIVGTLSMFVTLGYWLTIYDPKVHKIKDANYNNVIVHGMNAALALVDSMVVALPVRVSHFVYFVTFALIYASFSYIYEIGVGLYPDADKPYIYSLLNWRQSPGITTLVCFLAMLVGSIIHLTLWTKYIFRLFLVSSISCRSDKEDVHDYHHHRHRQLDLSCTNPTNSNSIGPSQSPQILGHTNPAFVENFSTDNESPNTHTGTQN